MEYNNSDKNWFRILQSFHEFLNYLKRFSCSLLLFSKYLISFFSIDFYPTLLSCRDEFYLNFRSSSLSHLTRTLSLIVALADAIPAVRRAG